MQDDEDEESENEAGEKPFAQSKDSKLGKRKPRRKLDLEFEPEEENEGVADILKN